MEIVECQRHNCEGIVTWNEELNSFLCNKCNALHE